MIKGIRSKRQGLQYRLKYSVYPESLQLAIQVGGIKFPYEFAVMLPYVLVILVLALARKARMRGPTSLGVPYNREMRY